MADSLPQNNMEQPPQEETEQPSPDRKELDLARQAPYIALFFFLVLIFSGSFLFSMLTSEAEKIDESPEKLLTSEQLETKQAERMEALKNEIGEETFDLVTILFGLFVIAVSAGSFAVFILIILSLTGQIGLAIIPKNPKPRLNYGVIAAVKFVIVFLASQIVFSSLASSIFAALGFEISEWMDLFLNGIAQLAGAGLFLLILLKEYGFSLSELGFGIKRIPEGIKAGSAGYYGSFMFIMGFMIVWQLIIDAIGLEKELNPLIDVIFEGFSIEIIIASLFVACIVAPLVEEFFFRGVLFASLERRIGWLPAAIISSLLFGISHVGFFNMIPTAVLGFIFALLYHRTNNIVAPIVAHAIHNAFSLTVLFVSIQSF